MAQVILDEYCIQEILDKVEKALLEDGFKDTPLQIEKPNQAFGLIKKLISPWELHIRGFFDGTLSSEIEISREYLEHLNDRYRFFAVKELIDILDRHKVPYKIIGKKPQAIHLEEIETPETLTLWEPIFRNKGLFTLFWIVGGYIKKAYGKLGQS